MGLNLRLFFFFETNADGVHVPALARVGPTDGARSIDDELQLWRGGCLRVIFGPWRLRGEEGGGISVAHAFAFTFYFLAFEGVGVGFLFLNSVYGSLFLSHYPKI